MEFPPDHTNGTEPQFSSSAPGERRRVGLVFDERMCKHSTPKGESHPENPHRIRAIWNKLKSAGIHQRCVVFDAKEAKDKYIAAVHTNNHINLIKTISSKNMASKRNMVAVRYDSIYFNEGSSESAYLAAGSVLEVAEKVARGELNSAFAIVRPPGHHAKENEPMGFCLYNNVAIATSFLLNQKELGINKILIVDWDVHHGNGTQKMFWKDSRVLFFSVHRHEYGSFYPTGDDGSHIMIGEGNGAGYNINVPWENGQCGDADYISVWNHILIPVATKFNPDIIIISAGFDAAIGDPLGGCRVTPHGYSIMLKKLMKFSRGKIIMALEGGYNLNSLANSVAACVEMLLEDKPIAESFEVYPFESTWRVIKAVREELNAFWPILAGKLPEELTTKVTPQLQIYSSQSEDEYDGPNALSEDLQEDVTIPLSKLNLSEDVDGAEMTALRSHNKHNVCAHLDQTTPNTREFAGIINFLRRSRIHHSISHRHNAYLSHQQFFWSNAEIAEQNGVTVIASQITHQPVSISIDDIRRVLRFGDEPEEVAVELNRQLVRGCFLRMKYTEDIRQGNMTKSGLCSPYKYLFHVLIHCLGSRKSGWDQGRETLQSAMVALVLNKPYNFSAMVFYHMKENIKRKTSEKFLMYPRFVQMILDDKLPDLPKADADMMKFVHMNDITLNRLKAYRNRDEKPPTKRLIGHLIDDAYVAPPGNRWRNDGSDSDNEVVVLGANDDSDCDDQGGLDVPPPADQPVAGQQDQPAAQAGEWQEPSVIGENVEGVDLPEYEVVERTEAGDVGKSPGGGEHVNVQDESSETDEELRAVYDRKNGKFVLEHSESSRGELCKDKDPYYMRSPPTVPVVTKGIVISEPAASQHRKRKKKASKLKGKGKEKVKPRKKKKKIELVVQPEKASTTQATTTATTTPAVSAVSAAATATTIAPPTSVQATVSLVQAFASINQMLRGPKTMHVSTTPPTTSTSMPPVPVNITFFLEGESSSVAELEKLKEQVDAMATITHFLFKKCSDNEEQIKELAEQNKTIVDQNKHLVNLITLQNINVAQFAGRLKRVEDRVLLLESKYEQSAKQIVALKSTFVRLEENKKLRKSFDELSGKLPQIEDNSDDEDFVYNHSETID